MSDYWKGSFNKCYLKYKESSDYETPDTSGCEKHYYMTGKKLNNFDKCEGNPTYSKGRYSETLFDNNARYTVWTYLNDRDYYDCVTLVWVEPDNQEQLKKKIVKERDIEKELAEEKERKDSIPDILKEIEEHENDIKALKKEIEELKKIPEQTTVSQLMMSCEKNSSKVKIFIRKSVTKNGKVVLKKDTVLGVLPDEFNLLTQHIQDNWNGHPIEIDIKEAKC